MNTQLTIQDLAGMLAESAGKDRLTAELFLREFTGLIQESLADGEVVNVEGLGTFGIDISEDQADETICKRLYFRPDDKFREQVNKPFSFFEKVEIADGVTFEDMEVVEGEECQMYESFREFKIHQSEEITEKSEKQTNSMVEENKSEEKPLQEEPKGNRAPGNQIEKDKAVGGVTAPQEEEKIVSDEEQEPPTVVEAEESEVVPADGLKENQAEEEKDVPRSEEEEVVVDFKKENTVQEKKHHKSHRSSHRRHKRHNWSKVLMGLMGIALVVGFIASVILLPRYKRMRRIAEAREYYIVSSADTSRLQRSVVPVAKDTLEVKEAETVPADVKEEQPSSVEKKEDTTKKLEETTKKAEVAKEKKSAPRKSDAKVIDTIKIKSGDLMTQLSLKYYGHKYFWVYIYLFNKDNIKDPNNVPIGTQLRIPAPEVYGIDSKNAASKKKAAALQSRILNGENVNPSEFN